MIKSWLLQNQALNAAFIFGMSDFSDKIHLDRGLSSNLGWCLWLLQIFQLAVFTTVLIVDGGAVGVVAPLRRVAGEGSGDEAGGEEDERGDWASRVPPHEDAEDDELRVERSLALSSRKIFQRREAHHNGQRGENHRDVHIIIEHRKMVHRHAEGPENKPTDADGQAEELDHLAEVADLRQRVDDGGGEGAVGGEGEEEGDEKEEHGDGDGDGDGVKTLLDW